MSTRWKKLPPVTGKIMGSLHAGAAPETLHLRTTLLVGFGSVVLSRDGESVWYSDESGRTRCHTAEWAERRAAKDPNHDWRLFFHAPLSDRTYQRQDAKKWVLVKQGQGFA